MRLIKRYIKSIILRLPLTTRARCAIIRWSGFDVGLNSMQPQLSILPPCRRVSSFPPVNTLVTTQVFTALSKSISKLLCVCESYFGRLSRNRPALAPTTPPHSRPVERLLPLTRFKVDGIFRLLGDNITSHCQTKWLRKLALTWAEVAIKL